MNALLDSGIDTDKSNPTEATRLHATPPSGFHFEPADALERLKPLLQPDPEEFIAPTKKKIPLLGRLLIYGFLTLAIGFALLIAALNTISLC